jgi:hypothetical protein
MAESNINVTPGSGGPNIDLELVDNGNARQVICVGDPTTGTKVAPVDATLGLSVNVTNSTSPLPTGAATSANQTNASQKTQIVDGSGNVIASTSNALNVEVTGAAGNLPANVTQYGSTNISTGTGASGAGIPRVTVSNDSNVLVTQSTSPWVDNLSQVGGSAITLGSKVSASSIPVVIASDQAQINTSQNLQASTLVQSATAATGVGVIVTLPAVVSQFHYITLIEIKKYFTVANAASATPLVVTTTNLPGSLAFTFGQPLGTVGTTDVEQWISGTPLKSSVVDTATTIVAPATTGIIWRINVFYYTAA